MAGTYLGKGRGCCASALLMLSSTSIRSSRTSRRFITPPAPELMLTWDPSSESSPLERRQGTFSRKVAQQLPVQFPSHLKSQSASKSGCYTHFWQKLTTLG